MYSSQEVRSFFQMNIDHHDPTHLDITPYRLIISEVLPLLCSASITTACAILLDVIAEYPHVVTSAAEVHPNARQYWATPWFTWNTKVGYFLNDIEGQIFLMLKARPFARISVSQPTAELSDHRDQALSHTLVQHAVLLPYDAATALFATLAGAWILSYPESYILPSSYRTRYFDQRTTTDDDYIFMLSSLLIEHGTAWMRA
jgi:hypothetical protein